MLMRRNGVKLLVLGALVVLGAPTTFDEAVAAPQAKQSEARKTSARSLVRSDAHAMRDGMRKAKQSRYARTGIGGVRGSILQCVPFARENSGIEITGNAGTWWRSADGVYERGSRPEVGSVLNFRAGGRSRLGHVAVVTKVLNPRMIEVDHANWSAPSIGPGRISRDMAVIDVSSANDWTAVRVEVGGGTGFGSVYPTFGFIYDRPDRGHMVANTMTAPPLQLDAALRDQRPDAERTAYHEVAEASDDAPRAAWFQPARADRPVIYRGARALATQRTR